MIITVPVVERLVKNECSTICQIEPPCRVNQPASPASMLSIHDLLPGYVMTEQT